jgi:hypothetical protein
MLSIKNSFTIKISALVLLILCFSGCSQECYTTPLQVKAKYENCADLGTRYSGRIEKNVWTFACTTSGNDVYADFIVKDDKYCRTYQQDS